MAGGRNPLVWTCALVLEEVSEGTLIGVVGRNYNVEAWDASLRESRHAVVVHAGTGLVYRKRLGTILGLPHSRRDGGAVGRLFRSVRSSVLILGLTVSIHGCPDGADAVLVDGLPCLGGRAEPMAAQLMKMLQTQM